MTRYSVQPRDRKLENILNNGFLSFAKNMGKNIAKNISKNLVRNSLIMLNNLQLMRLTLLKKEQFKKQ